MRKVLLFLLLLSSFAALAACEGCRTPTTNTPSSDADPGQAAVRLYLVSDLAGALEPCGCVKDQLGGMDHLGALVAKEKPKARAQVLVAAGPLFFMDATLADEKRSQEIAKADTVASSLKVLGLAAFAPGLNDFTAVGTGELTKLTAASGGQLLAANLSGAAPPGWVVREVGGIKLGIVGVADPSRGLPGSEPAPAGLPAPSPGVSPSDAVKTNVRAAVQAGAEVVVALAAVGRGEAKRIADANPELLAVLVGSPGSKGDANTEAPPAERVGDVLIVQTANHLQTVATLDLYPRDRSKGTLKLADGTGIERIRKREELSSRIDDLRKKIAIWQDDRSVDKRDVDARKADVAKLEAERAALDSAPPPKAGSFFRYAMRDVRDDLGADEGVHAQMLRYYKHVNDQNKVDLADRKPKPAAKGEASYAGIETCTTCHEEPRAVWDKTRHAHAYETLSKQFKEFNLDCVSCHVTGYDRTGGTTVTHVDGLKDVQCEVCHGPSSLYVAKPDKVKTPIPKPTADTCLACHHPPHVHAFDANAKMAEILGPGHGKAK